MNDKEVRSGLKGLKAQRLKADDQREANNSSRRAFLGTVAATITALPLAVSPAALAQTSLAEPDAVVGPTTARKRAKKAFKIRVDAAEQQRNVPLPAHPTNGDEERYPNQIASYTKALPHDSFGEVDLAAYNALVHAMTTGEPQDFQSIPMGGVVKLGNPQSSLAFDMEGADSHHLGTPAPPAFASEEEAGEMAELYWLALTRDVAFSDYGNEPLTIAALGDLSRFSNFSQITAANLFRGNTPGDLAGPYLSQFLWKDVPYGPMTLTQKYKTPLPGDDYMTAYEAWLAIQNGARPPALNPQDPVTRYIRNGRDMASWLRTDFTFQGFLNAALILLSFGPAALDDNNPYKASANQGAFITFGGPNILDLVARVSNSALKAAWYQKWSVHRRLRPEEFGGRVHNHKIEAKSYPIHTKLLDSPALDLVHAKYGTYLLPMAYPEGSPTHPAYPAGHAAIAGAGVTALKAFFKESFAIPDPVVADAEGQSLLPFDGTLTVGGELNKLASNVALGRDTAGVHWRSDGIEGMKLGEAVTISILRDMKSCYNEDFSGFSLTKFDGTTITI